jgi:4-alpha-glucanotransferase
MESPRANTYSDTIREATGVTDPRQLREIEDIMRDVVFHSTLDWQTKEQLQDAARQAVDVLEELARGELTHD